MNGKAKEYGKSKLFSEKSIQGNLRQYSVSRNKPCQIFHKGVFLQAASYAVVAHNLRYRPPQPTFLWVENHALFAPILCSV